MSRIASPSLGKAGLRRLGDVGDQSDAADRRGGQNAGALRLIVERDISGNDGEIQRPRGFADPLQAADELAHIFGPLRIAEIQIVGERQRRRAAHGDVAPAFSDRLLAALVRVGGAIARRDVGGQRQALRPFLHPDHGGVAAGRRARYCRV